MPGRPLTPVSSRMTPSMLLANNLIRSLSISPFIPRVQAKKQNSVFFFFFPSPFVLRNLILSKILGRQARWDHERADEGTLIHRRFEKPCSDRSCITGTSIAPISVPSPQLATPPKKKHIQPIFIICLTVRSFGVVRGGPEDANCGGGVHLLRKGAEGNSGKENEKGTSGDHP
jgi:hypothetical protein